MKRIAIVLAITGAAIAACDRVVELSPGPDARVEDASGDGVPADGFAPDDGGGLDGPGDAGALEDAGSVDAP